MDLSDLKWVSKRNLQTFWDGIKGSLFGDLAFHEDGAESAHAYSAGDLLGHESHLYRATSSIAAGDTLESGVNMERTLVDAEIKRSRQSVNTEFDPRLSNILGDLATVEAEMVATKNYNKGDYIVIGDYFYKATDAITSGDTLAVGTNIERTNVGVEMIALNSNTLVYSETEIPCGTWIDGKTIYKKTFSGTSTSGIYTVNVESCNMDQPIKAEFVMKNTNNGDFVLESYRIDSADAQAAYLTSNRKHYNFRSGSSFAYGLFYLTLYYTKNSS